MIHNFCIVNSCLHYIFKDLINLFNEQRLKQLLFQHWEKDIYTNQYMIKICCWLFDYMLHMPSKYANMYTDDRVALWVNHNGWHRTSGPAVISDKQFIYARNNIIHRDDGPAIIRGYWEEFAPNHITADVLKKYTDHNEWWQHGQLHRIGAPAIETIYGSYDIRWWEYGKPLSWWNILARKLRWF